MAVAVGVDEREQLLRLRLGEVALLHARDKFLGAEHAVLVDIHCVEDVHEQVQFWNIASARKAGRTTGSASAMELQTVSFGRAGPQAAVAERISA